MNIQQRPILSSHFFGQGKQPSKIKEVSQKLALSLALLLPAIGATGCTTNSTQIPIPDPPKNERLLLNSEIDINLKMSCSYILWDDSTHKFIQQNLIYFVDFDGKYKIAQAMERILKDGEVLQGTAIIDQANQKIILTNGTWIEGSTGNVYDKDGQLIKKP